MDAFAVLIDLLVAAAFVLSWKSQLFPKNDLRQRGKEMLAWYVFMATLSLGIYAVLVFRSASDVREDSGAVTLYFIFCCLFLLGAQLAFAFLGVSLRDDAMERGNRGAGFAVGGLTLGAACCLAGANVGNGPGPEVVVFCAILSVGTLFALWMVLATWGDAAEAITVERDTGAGLRTGGWLAGCGAILGASVAGDWFSVETTVKDLLSCIWPMIVASGGFLWVERKLNRRALNRRLGVKVSACIALVVLAAGAAYAARVVRQ